MTIDRRFMLRTTVHVTPIDDLREHEETALCWCDPTFELVDDDPDARIVIHHSADGRELIEQHGIN